MAANPPSQAAFTVETNGQTLVVSAGLSASGLTAELFSDAANVSALTSPVTITSDTTLYMAPGRAGLEHFVSCKQLDGTELWGRSQPIGPGSPAVIRPLPSAAQSASDVSRMGWGFPVTVDPDLVNASSTTVGTSNRCIYKRVRGAGVISKIGLYVNASSGNIGLAVYRNSGSGATSTPGTQLATTGAIACPGTGWQEVDLGSTITVNEGDWFALSADNTSAQFGSANNTATVLSKGVVGYQASSHPPPSSVTITYASQKGFFLQGIA